MLVVAWPADQRPQQEALDPDYDPWSEYEWPDRAGQLERAPRRKRVAESGPSGDDSPRGASGEGEGAG